MKFCPREPYSPNFSDFRGRDIFYETCFRRDVAWSQRNFFEQNQYVHRHQHPSEPRIQEFQKIDLFYCTGPLRICRDHNLQSSLSLHLTENPLSGNHSTVSSPVSLSRNPTFRITRNSCISEMLSRDLHSEQFKAFQLRPRTSSQQSIDSNQYLGRAKDQTSS